MPHVELALVLIRCAKPQSFVKPQGGICLYHPQSERSAVSRCLFDQAFDYLSANALASQSAVYEQLAEEQDIVSREALQPTNIRPVECNDSYLAYVPSLAKASDLSIHAQVQLLDDTVHSLEIQPR